MLESESSKDRFILLSCQIKKKNYSHDDTMVTMAKVGGKVARGKRFKKNFQKKFFIFFINIYNKIGRNYVTALRLLDIKG